MNNRSLLRCYQSIFLIALILCGSTLPLLAAQNPHPRLTMSRGNDWWPMFHHDPDHSGVSTADAPDDNQVLWSYQTQYLISSSPAISHGRVYIGSWDWNIYCLDMDTGSLLWNYSTDGQITSSPAVADGRIYVGSQDSTLYCLNAKNGSTLWEFTTGFIIESSPTVVDGMVFFGGNDGILYCLDADDGRLLWEYETGSVILSSPAVTDNKVYVGVTDGAFLCLNEQSGDVIWTKTMDEGTYSSPAVDGERVFFGSNDHHVYCLNAETGGIIWNYNTSSEVHSSPTIWDDLVFVGASDGRMLCLQTDTGSFVWSYQVNSGIEASPAVADGKVYFGSDPCCGFTEYFYCLDAFTGAQVWSYNFNTPYHLKSSAAIAAGKVFVGSGDGRVFSFGEIEFLADANGPYYGIIGAPVTFTGSVYGGQPDYSWFWEFGDNTTSTEQNPMHTYESLGVYQVTLSVTDAQGNTSTDETQVVIETPNEPPETPQKPTGSCSGKIQNEYTYITTTEDVDGDQVWYQWDWGDDSTNPWLGPYDSGAVAPADHTWTTKGHYSIKVKAKDSSGNESDWSESLTVIMPFSFYIPFHPLWMKLFERFPNAFPVLRHLMGY
jgi:outer membrane protein assembly factor BamB